MTPPNEPDNPSDDHPDTRPYLCIPYWTTPLSAGGTWDTGEIRPLPAEVVSYACDSIQTSPYSPGSPLDITVNVRNSGGGNGAAIATVAVYWADPTVGFGSPAFLAAAAVAVPPGRGSDHLVSTPKMTATIPATAPGHVCLLAMVTHSQDRPGSGVDPIHDRHWAQHNLLSVGVAPGAPAIMTLNVGNPFPEERTFILHVGPADERRARSVATSQQIERFDASARIRLLDEHGAAMSGDDADIRADLRLAAAGQRELQLMIDVEQELPAGAGVPLEAMLLDDNDEAVGSLGAVLVPAT